MNHPYLFITGITLLAYLLPELLIIFKVSVPQLFNIVTAISAALIAAAFLL